MTNFIWDKHSDQPYPIKDKSFKRLIFKKSLFENFKLIFTNLIMFPIVLLRYLFIGSKKNINTDKFIGLGVDSNKSARIQFQLLKDLNIKQVLIRIPLSDIENLDKYVEFIKEFQGFDILINILQDRRHIEDLKLLKDSISQIFEITSVYASKYQIGNAVNRKKWAFFNMGEYMDFYKIVQDIRDDKYPHIKLIGSCVIDFEYYFTIRTLFNFRKIKYDVLSSLLYVDRRGDPTNTQMGFDLYKKIKLLFAISKTSPKTKDEIYITETNWPISGTAPYAPTSEKECVSVEEYSEYLVKYFFIALSSGMIDRVYWHQLIAPGYGLIDDREGFVKYKSFFVLKHIIHIIEDSKITYSKISAKKGLIVLEKENQNISVVWGKEYLLNSYQKGFDIYLDEIKEIKENEIGYIVEPKN
ncbi:MAG: FIG00388565: hypothetical protein [uncultured Campylobacterales bacterium]|uniref:Glycosyl hydrolase n=1 Tax=uncultured Campylobacterales bacterium TaxID=352960 RepID=A0A6S6SVI5_9BACT|nr:MAG: FIG00388565: hypothetical protein [uncultured Campylobacterales bacterium]